MVGARVLPAGGPIDHGAKTFGSSNKLVEAPNPNRRFSKRPLSGSQNSTVFSSAPPPSPGRSGRARSKSPSFVDPFDNTRPDHVNNVAKQGVRVTRLDILQQEKARVKEVTPRVHRKIVDGGKGSMRTEGTDKTSIASIYGLTSSGGKGVVGTMQVNKQTVVPKEAPPAKDFQSTSRFRCSPGRTGASVMRAETLSDTSPVHKNQRFAHSPSRRHDSLVGVLAAAPPVKAPPSYQLKSPWHSE